MNRYVLNSIMLPLDFTMQDIKEQAALKLGIAQCNIDNAFIVKKSIDARRKPTIKSVLSVCVETSVNIPTATQYVLPHRKIEQLVPEKVDKNATVAVIGSGPAGMFAALTLSKMGYKPVVIERGGNVDEREDKIKVFENAAALDPHCNVQFGEGGAGTFSDGKLNTGTGSEYIPVVLGELVAHGAPQDILYEAKPHIGTDLLKNIVKNIRKDIESFGGKYYFNTTVCDIEKINGKVCLSLEGLHSGKQEFDAVIMAVGHSARDTYEMLAGRGVAMERKPFAVGVRIEHLQRFINKAMYGQESIKGLGAADYKLAAKTADGRGCFTFCMCPGGVVSAAASESGGVVCNGMSRHARDGKNANSALLVGVMPEDFGDGGVLAGVEFQRKYERAAFELGGRTYKAPMQNASDFLMGKISQTAVVEPSYPIGGEFVDLRKCLPKYVARGLFEGLKQFDNKIRGFASNGLLTGVETRSSAPVRILRDESMQSSFEGLYPCGEGAGYAGGITSAAVDGIKCAIALAKKQG